MVATETSVDLFATPGLEHIRSAYAQICSLGVDTLAAQDWLTDQVRQVVRDDIKAQVARCHGRPSPVALPAADHAAGEDLAEAEVRQILHGMNLALAVYNRRRPRLSIIDGIVTERGAAEVNRAAVVREVRGLTEGYARLRTFQVDTQASRRGDRKVYFVAATVIDAGSVRAASAVFVGTGNARGNLHLDRFTVVNP